MRRGAGFVAAWAGATIVAVIVAAAAVGSVRSDVTDQPTVLGSPSGAAIATQVVAGADASTTTIDTAPTDDTTADVSHPCDGAPSDCSESAEPEDGSTTTTTEDIGSSDSSSTTTAAAAAYYKTVDTSAGSVTFKVSDGQVTFFSAIPTTGWRVELDKNGPDEVVVKFESNDEHHDIEVKGQLEGGALKVTINSSDDD